MNRTNWIVGIICLSLLLIGGVALDVNAQQPPAAPAPAETTQTPESNPARPAPQSESSTQPQPPPSTNTQIETRTERTERIVEQPGTFLGVNATVAMVIGLVAMSRRGDEVRETRETRTRHQV